MAHDRRRVYEQHKSFVVTLPKRWVQEAEREGHGKLEFVDMIFDDTVIILHPVVTVPAIEEAVGT